MKFWENEMKKALNVLKDLCKVMTFNSYWLPRVDDAIKELEEAMKPKTCKGCIHGAEDMQAIHCVFCSRSCDDKFEPKDTQC